MAALRTDSDRRGPCRAPTDEPLDLAVGECVEGDGVRIDALAGSALAWTGDEVAVIDGEVLFEVAPRPDRPLRVIAGAASIEVVGTRFVVHHQGRRGWISMLEGRVIADDGRGPSRALEAGERLGWAGPTATTSARATTPARAPRSGDTDGDEGLTELLAEVAELRRRGAYEAAVERLRAGERPTWSRRARALVSYEIGVLLGRQAGDHEAACAHWAEHRRRFADAERDALLLRTLERLGCPP
ncbi:MAG: FecR family protein [Nannocystaceae bacterium]